MELNFLLLRAALIRPHAIGLDRGGSDRRSPLRVLQGDVARHFSQKTREMGHPALWVLDVLDQQRCAPPANPGAHRLLDHPPVDVWPQGMRGAGGAPFVPETTLLPEGETWEQTGRSPIF